MHLNKGWNPKVRPPRLPEERKGLFSTRSPHRPNAIALSSLRVGRVDAANGVIYVHGLDLLDGKRKQRENVGTNNEIVDRIHAYPDVHHDL